MVKFLLDNIVYVERYNDLGKVEGCNKEDGSDFQGCYECNYKIYCPAKVALP
jgi:hypothetical protein